MFWVLKKNRLNETVLLEHPKHTVKPVLNGHSKRRPEIGFQDCLLLNAGQKYCRMLQREHSAIFLTCIKLPYTIKIFVLSFLSVCLRQGLLYVKTDW